MRAIRLHFALLVALITPLLALAGCVFGKSEEDPFSYTLDVEAGAPSSGGSAATGGSSDVPAATGGAPAATGGAGGVTTTGGAPQGGGDAGGSIASGGTAPSGQGGTPLPTDECNPPPAAVCDPVKNIGCLLPVSYCDVDTTVGTKTGRCVFPATGGAPSTTPPAPTGPCTIAPLQSSCAPLFTCFEGACRKLCNCDADCGSTESCTADGPGPRGAFKLCAPSSP
jgi:hypothetical protein